MIALIITAIAAALTPQEFQTVISQNVATYERIKQIGDDACGMQERALRLEANLQSDLDDGKILVMSDELNVKLSGDPHWKGHQLTPDEAKALQAKIHEIDFEAREYAVRCRRD